MSILFSALLRLAGAVIFALLARAVLFAINALGFSPERWVAEAMVGVATGSAIEVAVWGLSGIFGIAGLIIWEWFKLGNRIARLLPQTTKQIEREDYDRLKGLIGESMLCGRMLYTVNQPDREKAKTLVGKWKATTCNLITAGLGQGENWRFLSDDGIVTYSGKKDAIDVDVERRLIRLNEIMQSISPEKCSPSFDPEIWEDQFNSNEFT